MASRSVICPPSSKTSYFRLSRMSGRASGRRDLVVGRSSVLGQAARAVAGRVTAGTVQVTAGRR
jgi:hypothetical protein